MRIHNVEMIGRVSARRRAALPLEHRCRILCRRRGSARWDDERRRFG